MFDPHDEDIQPVDYGSSHMPGHDESADYDVGGAAEQHDSSDASAARVLLEDAPSVELDESGHYEAEDRQQEGTDANEVCPPGIICHAENDQAYTVETTTGDPFPGLENQSAENAVLPAQVIVRTEHGESSAFAVDLGHPNADGSLTLVGVKHAITGHQEGDIVQASLQLPGDSITLKMTAIISGISQEHDRYFARIDPDSAEALRQNFASGLVLHTDVMPGENVGFTQQAGVDWPVFRDAVVGGRADDSGDLVTLNCPGMPGMSGALVSDQYGHVVGQVQAYDPRTHVTLMATAEQIRQDIDDFRLGQNLEKVATPVSYHGAVAPIIQRGL